MFLLKRTVNDFRFEVDRPLICGKDDTAAVIEEGDARRDEEEVTSTIARLQTNDDKQGDVLYLRSCLLSEPFPSSLIITTAGQGIGVSSGTIVIFDDDKDEEDSAVFFDKIFRW